MAQSAGQQNLPCNEEDTQKGRSEIAWCDANIFSLED
jgi:hypothetical protein